MGGTVARSDKALGFLGYAHLISKYRCFQRIIVHVNLVALGDKADVSFGELYKQYRQQV